MLVSRWLDNYNSDANVSQAIFVRSKLLPPHIFSLVQREEEIKKTSGRTSSYHSDAINGWFSDLH